MPTQCNPGLFDFAPVEGRQVVGGFDGGVITSDAGALLFGRDRPRDPADRALHRLLRRSADARIGGTQRRGALLQTLGCGA